MSRRGGLSSLGMRRDGDLCSRRTGGVEKGLRDAEIFGYVRKKVARIRIYDLYLEV
jgi:hypothetical protein